jgi:hypothetical protein
MSESHPRDKKVIPIAVVAPVADVPESPTGAMIRTLGLVSAICGLIIVGAYQGTYDAVRPTSASPPSARCSRCCPRRSR